MALVLQRKKEVVAQIAEMASKVTSIVAADYRGIKSRDMTELRAKLRQIDGVNFRIVQNTLAKRALMGTSYEPLAEYFQGPVALTFTNDPGTVAKVLKDFAKEKEKLSVTALFVEGKLLEGNKLDAIANLPTKQEVLTKLVMVMQAPIAKLVKTMAEPTAKLVRTVSAISNKKQEQ